MKKSINKTLVYEVNPLPDSLLNFVVNFGKLEDEDEMKYIKEIIYDSMHKIYIKNTKRERYI